VSQDDVDSAQRLAVIGLLAGLVGFVVAVVALLKGRSSSAGSASS